MPFAELTKWADIFVVAPADALTISKLAHGHCDNLLTCALLAWPMEASSEFAGEPAKPLVLCPSMNTKMWAHPATTHNLKLVRSYGAEIVGPISKRLMCGDVGAGAMEEPERIAKAVEGIARRERKGKSLSVNTVFVPTWTLGAAFGAVAAFVFYKKLS